MSGDGSEARMVPPSDGEPTAVTIYGRTYHLRGAADPDYLAELALEVDRRMRDVAEATGTADTTKVAILAALNIADDCFRTRRDGISREIEDRLGRLVAGCDEVLADPAFRPTGAKGRRTESA
jgi:cell division protein ZapA